MELDRAVHGDAGAPCVWDAEATRQERSAVTPARGGRPMQAVELHPADRIWLQAVLARCCPDPADREDLLQEVLIRLSRNAGAHALVSRHRPWLRSVALNCWRDQVRRARRLPAGDGGDELLERLEGREPVPGDVAEEAHWTFEGLRVPQSMALRAIARAMQQLCPADRRALAGHYGIGPGVAPDDAPSGRCRLHRARARLVMRLRPALLVERAAEEG